MSKNKLKMVKTGKSGHWEHYRLVPSALITNGVSNSEMVSEQYGGDSANIFNGIDDEDDINTMQIFVNKKQYNYVPFGEDDNLPLTIKKKIAENMVTSQGMFFDILACYGKGVRFIDRKTKKDTEDSEIRDFCLSNSLHECFMQDATDMKFYFFTVMEIILSRDKSKIVKIKHLDSSKCRFEKKEDGIIRHIFYGDFRNNSVPLNAAAIPLLDVTDPLGDLLVRQGKEPDPEDGKKRTPEDCCKYAVLCRMPTPGCRYYPIPYYMSIFRDDWYDIYKLIGLGKKYMIKNTSAPRIIIEVHDDYWDTLCDYENIIDPDKRKERIDEEKNNLEKFVCGPENAGKAICAGYYIDPNGKEVEMVRIKYINDSGKKEGGDWADDMQEASNALCFALGVHPNLIGATPGKSQMNNSGSDKRELFNLKQSLETAFHDIMTKPYHLVLHYNKWADKYTVDVPIIQLTTLDENKSQKTVSMNNQPEKK